MLKVNVSELLSKIADSLHVLMLLLMSFIHLSKMLISQRYTSFIAPLVLYGAAAYLCNYWWHQLHTGPRSKPFYIVVLLIGLYLPPLIALLSYSYSSAYIQWQGFTPSAYTVDSCFHGIPSYHVVVLVQQASLICTQQFRYLKPAAVTFDHHFSRAVVYCLRAV